MLGPCNKGMGNIKSLVHSFSMHLNVKQFSSVIQQDLSWDDDFCTLARLAKDPMYVGRLHPYITYISLCVAVRLKHKDWERTLKHKNTTASHHEFLFLYLYTHFQQNSTKYHSSSDSFAWQSLFFEKKTHLLFNLSGDIILPTQTMHWEIPENYRRFVLFDSPKINSLMPPDQWGRVVSYGGKSFFLFDRDWRPAR